MSQAIKGIVRMRVPAGQAAPSPAIGQALGPLGVNMMEFCKAFNDRTKTLKPGVTIPVSLTAFQNRTFEFETKTPPTTWFLKKAAGIENGSSQPGTERGGYVTLRQIYEIAKIKQEDWWLSDVPLEGVCRQIMSTAKSMGVEVVNDKKWQEQLAKKKAAKAESSDA